MCTMISAATTLTNAIQNGWRLMRPSNEVKR
jgi:hypothetical protein